MPVNQPDPYMNPLVAADMQDTLLNTAAVLACLQHIDLKIELGDEAELGMNLILETVRTAVQIGRAHV